MMRKVMLGLVAFVTMAQAPAPQWIDRGGNYRLSGTDIMIKKMPHTGPDHIRIYMLQNGMTWIATGKDLEALKAEGAGLAK